LKLKEIITEPQIEQSLGRKRIEILTQDNSQKSGYKKEQLPRQESDGILFAGKGIVIELGKEKKIGFVDTRETWDGGTRLTRRYENGALYLSILLKRGYGKELEIGITKDGNNLTVETRVGGWYARKGYEPILLANTPRSDLFLDRLNGFSQNQVQEFVSITNGEIQERKMQVDSGNRWVKIGGRDLYETSVLDYYFEKGAAEEGKDIAVARYGSWRSPGGLWDAVSRRRYMGVIEQPKRK
jgi:hypothetical protein